MILKFRMDEYKKSNIKYNPILIDIFFNIKLNDFKYLLIEIDDTINSEYVTENLTSSKN
jgi:hypothetical protein